MVTSVRSESGATLEPPPVAQSLTSNTPDSIEGPSSNRPRSLLGSQPQRFHADTVSDRATSAFIRRTICSPNVLLGNGEKGRSTPRPIEDMLPPLTSSNEVDLQLYGIISVIMKEFVQTWYSKITPDHVFINEVIQTIAHCTRALEQRLRNVDLEALLLDELPELLEAHLTSFRLARHQASSPTSLASESRLVYHALHPHPALSPVPADAGLSIKQREAESAWRQLLVQGALAVLLPTEDLENGCLRALVAEVFAEMILGNGISGRVCEGWLLWDGITSIAKALQKAGGKDQDPRIIQHDGGEPPSRLDQYELLSPTNEAQPASPSSISSKEVHRTILSSLSSSFWILVQYAFLAVTAARVVLLHLVTTTHLPSRSATRDQSPVEAPYQSQMPQQGLRPPRLNSRTHRPIIDMKIWSCIAQVTEIHVRMPWLSGIISMLHWAMLRGPGKVGDTDGVLDRLLSHTFQTRVLNPALLPAIIRSLRVALFPDNGLASARPPPSEEEIDEIKRRCATSILASIPNKVAATFFASDTPCQQRVQLEELLACLEDPYLNKHLVYHIVELVILRVIPELGEQSVKQLMSERIG